MNNEPGEHYITFVSILVVFCMISAFFSNCSADKAVRNEAVKNKVARWVANEDGSVKFEWKVPVEKEKE